MEPTRSTRFLAALRQVIARRANEAEEGAESGFTLIELMVVLLIMAILLAIAIPTFLGVKGGAQDRSAQSDLTNGLTAAKAYYTNNGSYGTLASAVVTAMNSSEPELTWTTAAVTSGDTHNISLDVYDSGNVLVLATESASGTCWYAADVEASGGDTTDVSGAGHAGIWYASQTMTTATTCDAATLTGVANWGDKYPSS